MSRSSQKQIQETMAAAGLSMYTTYPLGFSASRDCGY